MRNTIFGIIILAFSQCLFGQTDITLEEVRSAYQSFSYQEVVTSSNLLLRNNTQLSDNDKIEVYTMKAVALYSLNQAEDSRKNFIELLKINSQYELNTTLISPKIIDFFSNIKNDYKQIASEIEQKPVVKDPEDVEKIDLSVYTERNSLLKSAITKSILLPGLGHIEMGENTKGWLLSSASVILLSGIAYSLFETNSREEAYLLETNLDLIPQKYDDYNKTYKIRNIVLITYAAVWLYTQIDLLLFNNELPDQIVTFLPSVPTNNSSTINLSLKVKL